MFRVIATVGTSIFENYKKDNPGDLLYEDYLEKPYSEVDEERNRRIKARVENWMEGVGDKHQISAEIKSLLKLKEEKKGEELNVYFLATDTVASSFAAEIIKEFLGKEEGVTVFYSPDKHVIKDLQVEDSIKFEKSGLLELIKTIENISGGYYGDVIFNITGGYKATIPFLTIMAQIKQCPVVYIFEKTDRLITIPQIPISVDWGLFEKYYDLLAKLYKGMVEVDDDFKKSYLTLEDGIKCLIWEDGESAELNAFGKFFFNLFETVFIVYVYKGSNFFNDKAGNRKELEESFKELYSRLVEIINQNNIKKTEDLLNFIDNLGEQNDLRHGSNPAKDKFIFKSTKKTQIRIVYSPKYENNILSLHFFDYVRGNFNHKDYINEFKKKWETMRKNIKFVSIPINKP